MAAGAQQYYAFYSGFIAIFSTKAYSELFFILPVSWR
jgi:hypothetical protein